LSFYNIVQLFVFCFMFGKFFGWFFGWFFILIWSMKWKIINRQVIIIKNRQKETYFNNTSDFQTFCRFQRQVSKMINKQNMKIILTFLLLIFSFAEKKKNVTFLKYYCKRNQYYLWLHCKWSVWNKNNIKIDSFKISNRKELRET
jgi:hypothetical protein